MKKYLSETIGDSYLTWNNRKIFISADTGFGKTFFIILVYLKYVAIRRGKLLILCNRRLLRYQYWFDLIERYTEGGFLEEYVELATYQQMTERLLNAHNKSDVIRDYTDIIFDEVHYFYSDSDFNGFGTFLLFKELIQLCFKKTLIFMSATIEPIEPFIREGISRARLNQNGRYIKQAPGCKRVEESYKELEQYGECINVTHSQINTYKNFHCIYFEMMEDLAEYIAKSDKKSILFIDDKSKAKAIKEAIIGFDVIPEKEIVIINADNLSDADNNSVIEQLTIAHRVESHVLITTSVLDNGVSIHDEDVGNLLIVTDSRVSFMQMIGRVRNESCAGCNLLFLRRRSSDFKYRMTRLEKEVSIIEDLSNRKSLSGIFNIQMAWGADEDMAAAYRKFLLPVSEADMEEFIEHPFTEKRNRVKGVNLVLNEFAVRKTRDMYMITSLFYSLAVKNPVYVVHRQMEWINKTSDDLEYYIPEGIEPVKEEIYRFLLQVKDYKFEKYQEMRKNLTDKYRDFIKRYYEKGLRGDRPLTKDSLYKICEDFNLVTKTYDKEGHRYYSICKKEGDSE